MKNNTSDPIIKELSEALKKELGYKIKDIILFGSRARGDASPESDYDLLVLVDKETKDAADRVFNMTCEIGWKYNVVITPFVHDESYYADKKYEPLFMNVRKEGVHI